MEESLREAACVGNLLTVKKMVENGVSVNSQNSMNGWYVYRSLLDCMPDCLLDCQAGGKGLATKCNQLVNIHIRLAPDSSVIFIPAGRSYIVAPPTCYMNDSIPFH